MKKLLIAVLAAGAAISAQASTVWELTKVGWKYQVDTLYHATIGPGTTYTELRLLCPENSGTDRLNVFYTTVDISNPNVAVRQLMAKDERDNRQNVDVIAKEHSKDGVVYIAGVNSDFFNMSRPYYTNGACVSNGVHMAPMNVPGWNHLMIDRDNVPSLVTSDINTSFPLTCTAPGGESYYLYRNTVRYSDYLVLFDESYGTTTKTNMWGSEVPVMPVGEVDGVTGQWELIDDPTPANTKGSMTIPAGGAVLSGNGAAATYLSQLKKGDVVNIGGGEAVYKVDGYRIYPRELSGCRKILLKNGVQIDESSGDDPRTLAGFSEDGTKMVFMVIDGRSDVSKGAYYRLCAAIMQAVGCHNAVEFDGGGSSTMYCRSLGGIMNVPSEGELRPVAVGMYVETATPSDWNVTSIEVVEKNVCLEVGETFTPHVFGFNPAGILIDNNVTGYKLQCSPELGTISADGRTLTATGKGIHPLTVTYGQLSITIPVQLPGEAGGVGSTTDGCAPFAIAPNPVKAGETVTIAGADDLTVATVYTLGGQLVGTSQGTRLVAPAPGHYVVVVNGATLKMVVK